MSASARLLALWVRIPPGHVYMFVLSVVFCQVEIPASDCSLVRRSPTDCGVSQCYGQTSIMRRPWPTGACCAMDNVVPFGLVCSMLRALIICLQFSMEPTNAFGLKNVILLPSNYRHVSATQVAIFRVMTGKLLCVEITPDV